MNAVDLMARWLIDCGYMTLDSRYSALTIVTVVETAYSGGVNGFMLDTLAGTEAVTTA